MYITDDFHITELVPVSFYNQYGRLSSRGIDIRVVNIAQCLRNLFGAIIINKKDIYNESGLRTPDCEYYKEGSDHARGTALDLRFEEIKEREVYSFIIENKEKFISMNLTAIEVNTWDSNGNGWLHISVANYMATDLVIFDNNKNGAIVNPEVLC